MDKKNEKFYDSWFFKWVVDNRAVSALIILILTFLALYLLTKISFIFVAVASFLTVVMLPIVISVLLYYLLKPIVNFFEKYFKISRIWAISLVYLILAGLIFWGTSSFLPTLQNQIMSFVKNLPDYVKSVEKQVNKVLDNERLTFLRPQLENLVNNYSGEAVKYAENFSKNIVSWASDFAGVVAKVAIAIIMAPFIVFYLLRDSHKLKGNILKTIPIKWRTPMSRILSDINSQWQGYVQGQVMVAIVVGIMFSILFSVIGLRYAVTFGILAGFLNMIPYLGSFLAMVPVVILGLVEGPWMLIKVLLVFTVEQTIEGRFVSPLVLGTKLSIHPIMILFILLASGSVFGVWGILLGIPIYASLKVVVKELFDWYRSFSGLYEESEQNYHVK
ncbi:AI-2E family transporter [Streptococcus dentapri]|uniref:AI-2E family transporter n=1 Tax=Streptococcus dentapri TaxID=573564 RepID=A0ABV8D273_9STRE